MWRIESFVLWQSGKDNISFSFPIPENLPHVMVLPPTCFSGDDVLVSTKHQKRSTMESATRLLAYLVEISSSTVAFFFHSPIKLLLLRTRVQAHLSC